MVQLSHLYMTTGKATVLILWTFVGKVMFLLFNTLSRFAITFLSRSKHLLIPWLQSLSKVILEPRKIKSVTLSNFSPSIYHDMMGLDAMILGFLTLRFKLAFSLSSFTLIKRFFSCLFSSTWPRRVYVPLSSMELVSWALAVICMSPRTYNLGRWNLHL